MTPPTWADAEWSPFGVALEPVYEPAIEFGTAAVYTDAESFLASLDHTPELDDTGAPVIEWAPATREQLGDGDTVRVTQVGRWKGTRLVGKVTTYERKPASA